MGGQAKRVGVCHKASHHAHVIRFLQLHVPHGQEGIAWSFGTLNNGRRCGQLSQDGREITWEFRQGPLHGHVLAVEAGYGGDHWSAFQVSVREWYGCRCTRRQDFSNRYTPCPLANSHQLSTARQTTTTCCASMPATLHSDRNSDQWPATYMTEHLPC